MKIAIVIGFFYSHMQYLENVLLAELSKRHDVRVFTTTESAPGNGPIQREGSDESFSILRLKPDFLFRNIAYSKALKEVLFAWGPDALIVVSAGQFFAYSVINYAQSRGIPIVSFFSDAYSQYAGMPRWLQRFKRYVFYLSKGWLYRKVVNASLASFGVLQDTLDIINPLVGEDKKLILQPLPYSSDLFHYDRGAGDCFRREYGIDSSDILFLAVGRVVAEKKLTMLVDAFKRARSLGDTKLLIVGLDNGDESQRLEQLCGGDSQIILLGMQPAGELQQIMNACDTCVWPRQPAITIQQGVATGIWCVLPDNRYNRYLMKTGGGILFEANSVDGLQYALEDAILRIDDLRGLRQERASAAHWLCATEMVAVVEGLVCENGAVEVAS